MTRLQFALSSILVLAIVAVVAAHTGRETAPKTSAAVPARSFEFTYQVHVPARQDSAGPTHLWIPLPQADGYQASRGLHFDSPVSYVQGRDLEYGNAFAAFTPTAQQSAAGFDVVLRFTAVRREHRVALDSAALQRVSASASRDPNLQRFLEPDKLVPLNGRIAELAKEHTARDTTPIQKARHFSSAAHATNRVFFTYGRDIRLSPEHKSDPLNYFIYPYAETNGQPMKNLQTHFSFRDVSAEQFAAAGR